MAKDDTSIVTAVFLTAEIRKWPELLKSFKTHQYNAIPFNRQLLLSFIITNLFSLSVFQLKIEAAKLAALKTTAPCSSEMMTPTYEKHAWPFCRLFNNHVNGSEDYTVLKGISDSLIDW